MILAVSDLTAAEERLRAQSGLAAIPGGRHRGLGTANAIVPLGAGYLELVAVVDAAEAAGGTFGRWATAALARGDGSLMGWAVAVDDVEPVARRLGTPVEMIERDGLSARHTGMASAAAESALPFFIARGEHVADPGDAPADHDVEPRGIARLDVGGDGGVLSAWLGDPGAAARLGIDVVAGPPMLHAVTIATTGTPIRLPTGADPHRPSPSPAGSR